MAFINQVFAKDQSLLKVGTSYDSTVRTLTQISGPRVEFAPKVADSSVENYTNKVLVFDNGQTKTVESLINDANTTSGFANNSFNVDPDTTQIPIGTSFTVHNTSMYIDDASRIHFGKAYPDSIMTNETGIDLNFGRIRNVSLPTHAHDVATKQYVDSQKMGTWNHIQIFQGNGTQTEFIVTEPISVHNALISVGGVIQQPYVSYEIDQYSTYAIVNFKNDPPPAETDVVVRGSTATNVSMSPAIEEIKIAQDGQDTFELDNEVFDKYGLLISIDGVVQSTLNYDILTTPVQVATQNGSKVYKGNEYKILKFVQGLSLGAVVRILNIRGKNFHSHVGTYILLDDGTYVPNTTFTMNSEYFYDTLANSNNTVNITHDMIASRGGLHLYANTTVSDLYINLPEMGGEYSPDQHLEVKIVKGLHTANVYINADQNNYMNYEGAFDGHLGGGVIYNKNVNSPSVIHLEYESFYRTWYIKYGVGLWYVDANTVSYPDISPYP